MKSILISFILIPFTFLSQKVGDSLDFELYSSSHYIGTITKIEDDGYFIRMGNNREIYLSFFEIKSKIDLFKLQNQDEKNNISSVDTPISINTLKVEDEITVLLNSGESFVGKLTNIESDKIYLKPENSNFKIFFLSQIKQISYSTKEETSKKDENTKTLV